MSEPKLPIQHEANLHSLREMRECLFILQNSYDAITVTIERLLRSSIQIEQPVLEILQTEIHLTNIEIEKLHTLINHQLLINEGLL